MALEQNHLGPKHKHKGHPLDSNARKLFISWRANKQARQRKYHSAENRQFKKREDELTKKND